MADKKRKPQPPPSKAVKAATGPDNTFRNIVLVLVAVVALGTALGIWYTSRSSTSAPTSASAPPTAGADWAAKAAAIPGILDQHTKAFDRNHVTGTVTYPNTPPIGGNHNALWQNCMGDIYPGQIANEHAVHSLEHGAVWITYDPAKLPADQVTTLESKVRGVPYTMLSQYPNQGSPISLQAWGWQLKVDNATDPRIDEFIRTLRVNASQEPGAPCSGGNTTLGTTP